MSRRDRKRNAAAAFGTVLIVLAVVFLGVALLFTMQQGDEREAIVLTMPDKTLPPAVTPAPTPSPTPKPAARASATARPAGGKVMEVRELPVYWHLKTDKKVIAITVDDCNEYKQLKAILDVCEKNKAKITVFPIGENLRYDGVADQIRRAYRMGMELENHTMTHSRLYTLDEMGMAKEIYGDELLMSKTLGVRYKMHFVRTRGGDNRDDPRTQSYMASMGYLGMAHWSFVGTQATQEEIRAALKPGAVYLFHTLEADAENLKSFIPYAIKKGYKLVTLNQLLSLPDNETGDLPDASDPYWTIEDPGAYVISEYRTLKAEMYTRDVYLLQERLLELGYLQYSAPTGYYGQMTVEAVRCFQQQHAITVDGEAGPATQALLYSEIAQEISKETIARYERETGKKYTDYR